MPKVVMYCTKSCPYCIRAERLLKKLGASIEIIDVGNDPKLWKAMEKRSGRKTVPQIYIDDLHVGGFDDMSDLDRAGKLQSLLAG